MALVEIGEVLKPQGIKGEIKVRHFCDSAEVASGFETVYLKEKSGDKPLLVIKARADKTNVFLKLEGIDDRDEAEALRGQMLYADESAFPELPEDIFYIRDLIGLLVVDDTGTPMGKITEVLQHGAVDVYCVKDEKTSFMFPALNRVIISTDIAAGKMVLKRQALNEVAVYED
ncbi:MAG: ribosome maturation factor RimM [Eubacteriales bacterium]